MEAHLDLIRMIEPAISEDGMVRYGRNGSNIKMLYEIDPKDYLEMHKKLVDLGLKTANEEFAHSYIKFILYCNELLNLEFDISNLISEFNGAQENDYNEVKHAISLAKVCYHYVAHGHDVKIIPTTGKSSRPDLIIDSVKCDLKVRHDQINQEMNEYFQLLEKDKDRYYEIYFDKIKSRKTDLKSALENRGMKGMQQAECLIFDLSDHFHSWNFHRIKECIQKYGIGGFSQKPLKPVAGYQIIFSPDNAPNRNKPEFKPKAYWGYVLWDHEKRIFLN